MLESPELKLANFEHDGFALFRSAINEQQLEELLSAIESVRSTKTSPSLCG